MREKSPARPPPITYIIHQPASRAPHRGPSAFPEPVMTKRKPRAKTSVSRAAASKTSATKRSAALTNGTALIVLGFDDQQKPRGARFDDAKPDLVAKAADLMGLKVYRATTPGMAAVAKRLPIGRLYANGRGFV